MNWKQVLYKGLPVFLVAAAIIIIAAIASRPEPQPEVTNKDEVIVNFLDYKVSKGDLYSMMKKNRGVTSFVNLLDRQLLQEDYEELVDMEDLEDYIAELKAQSESGFYENMIAQGAITSEDDPNREEKIKDFYLLTYLQKAYAREQAIENLGEETIEDAKDNYVENPDMCVIILEYATPTERTTAVQALEAATDKQAFFNTEFLKQNDQEFEENDPITTEELPFLANDFECKYDLVSYDMSDEDLRDFIYQDTAIGSYTETPQLIGDHYNLVYRYAKPEFIQNYATSEVFENYIVEKLLDNEVNDAYVADKILALHNELELKIYDKKLGEDYIQFYDADFQYEEKLIDDTTIATYKNPDTGETVHITADDLYTRMKNRYGVSLLMDQINYTALTKVSEIALSEEEQEAIVKQKNSIKESFLQQQQQFTWNEYLEQYGVFSDEQLINFLAGQTLKNKYISEVDKITIADKEEMYEKWFEVTGRHVLFKYDPNDQESIDEARNKAEQIINGCTDANPDFDPNESESETNKKYIYRDGITEESCIVFYDPENPTKTDVPFKGLDETKVGNYTKTFEFLASQFSKDNDDNTIGEDLGTFGPGSMVEDFQEAVRSIALNIENGGDKYSTEPVNNEEYNGFHVIYISDYDLEKPEKPENYEEIKIAMANNNTDEYTQEEIDAVKAYDNFINQKVVPILERKRLSQENMNYYLAKLRDEKDFSFKDETLQSVYENIQATHLDKEDEE